MKNTYLNIIFGLIILFMGCKEFAEYRDVILFTGTENSPVIKFTLEKPSSMGVTITATDKVKTNTKVTIAVAKDLLESYNANFGRNYLFPSDDTYELMNNETIIKAGETVSEVIQFAVKSLDNLEEGKSYCVPLSITDTDGDMPILEASKTVYVVINRTVIGKAVTLEVDGGGIYAFNVPKFMTDPRVLALGAVTMEIRVRINEFQPDFPASLAISTVMGIEENFLLRFGNQDIIESNQLQMAPAVISGAKFTITGNTRYQTNKWYHLACVYDGSSIAIYVDGTLDVKFAAGPGTINFNAAYFDGFWFGKSVGDRRLNGAISEARFWIRALSLTEIQDNACFVDTKSEGLLAYWRFNAVQEDGKTIRDETGNGFDAISEIPYVFFIDDVRCP